MKIRHRVLVLALAVFLALFSWGCVYDEPWIPIPVPPIPVPPVPPIPTPDSPVSRDVFVDVEVGGPSTQLEGLPPWERKVDVGEETIYLWTLDEKRSENGSIPGYVRFEIHVKDGIVTASFAF